MGSEVFYRYCIVTVVACKKVTVFMTNEGKKPKPTMYSKDVQGFGG
jgi:hypothetical protein